MPTLGDISSLSVVDERLWRFSAIPESILATWAFTRTKLAELCRDRSAFDRNSLNPWVLMANKSTLSPLKALQEILQHPRHTPFCKD
jgi:hypothetical protein